MQVTVSHDDEDLRRVASTLKQVPHDAHAYLQCIHMHTHTAFYTCTHIYYIHVHAQAFAKAQTA